MDFSKKRCCLFRKELDINSIDTSQTYSSDENLIKYDMIQGSTNSIHFEYHINIYISETPQSFLNI